MMIELNDEQMELVRDTLKAELDSLSEQIDTEGLPGRRTLRDRRVILRRLCNVLETHPGR